MMIVTSLRLPVGERVVLSALRSGRKSLRGRFVIQDPIRGEYDGPILVCREVTKAQYCDWHEEETGPLSEYVKRVSLGQPRLKFYEIAID